MSLNEIELWPLFAILVLGLLTLDLGVFHRQARVIRVRESLRMVALWIALALVFGVVIYFWIGSQKALEYLTGYLIEYSLSVDNMFVFLLVFTYFGVSAQYQHSVLFWGIIGALVMRGIFIVAGVALIETFSFMIYIFGLLLIVTGTRMFFQEERQVQPERNPVIRLARKFLPLSPEYAGGKFVVKVSGRRLFTPLFIVLLAVESTDLIFAVDSIPAILAITQDPFIVYTSNVFAILGLRALYFALAGIMGYFHYLRLGLASILVFVGVKMLVSDLFDIPTLLALGVVGGILLLSILASLLRPPPHPRPKPVPLPNPEGEKKAQG